MTARRRAEVMTCTRAYMCACKHANSAEVEAEGVTKKGNLSTALSQCDKHPDAAEDAPQRKATMR